MFETTAYKELFDSAEQHTVPWYVGITEDGILDRLLSKSYLTEQHLNGERREEFIKKIRGIVRQATHEWIDKEVSLHHVNQAKADDMSRRGYSSTITTQMLSFVDARHRKLSFNPRFRYRSVIKDWPKDNLNGNA